MEQTLTVTYINCGFCTAKNHCTSCSRELTEALLGKPGIEAALVNVPERTLRLTHTLDSDALEDLLDAMGLCLS